MYASLLSRRCNFRSFNSTAFEVRYKSTNDLKVVFAQIERLRIYCITKLIGSWAHVGPLLADARV